MLLILQAIMPTIGPVISSHTYSIYTQTRVHFLTFKITTIITKSFLLDKAVLIIEGFLSNLLLVPLE